MDWPTRMKICLGIARGLAYLHEESRLKIVHRDIKATNVLLDKDLNAKISDFGLAKLDEEENTHISTRIAGTVLVFCYIKFSRIQIDFFKGFHFFPQSIYCIYRVMAIHLVHLIS